MCMKRVSAKESRRMALAEEISVPV
jgi:hypothetical protein